MIERIGFGAFYSHRCGRYFICNWSCEPREAPRHLGLIGNEVIPHFR